MGTIAGSPPPWGVSASFFTRTVSIRGSHEKRGISYEAGPGRTILRTMEQVQLTWIANFIWNVADDVLRDLYVRGKYRDVILPMTVLRRLDAVLEPTKKAVLDMKASLDKARIVHQDQALRQAAGQALYNTSPFTMRDLLARASQQQLRADFEAYRSPSCASEMTSFTPRSPRLTRLRRNAVQKGPSSDGPASTPRIWRSPSVVTPIATTVAIACTRPSWRTLW